MCLFACVGEHGAVGLPGGGERGVVGGGFKAQPAAMLQRWTRLEHAAAELSGHRCREQVGMRDGGSAWILCFHVGVDSLALLWKMGFIS